MGFPGLPILWVVAGDFLKDGERHVVDVVTREVEVGPGGLVQPLVSHIAKVFCPSLLCCVLCFSNILKSALAALHDVDKVLVLAGVVSGQLIYIGKNLVEICFVDQLNRDLYQH